MCLRNWTARAALAAAIAIVPVAGYGQSLTQVLVHAYENSPTLASAFLSVRAAGQGIRSAEGAYLPSVGASASVNATYSPNMQGDYTISTSDQFGLSYNQTLFDNFASDAAIRAARENYDASVHTAANTEQNVLLQAATAFYNVILNRRIVDIRRENLGFVQTQLEAARDRLELGEGTRLDVAQAESSQAQAQASYQAAVNNLTTSEAQFISAVGMPPASLSDNMSVARLIPNSVDAALALAEQTHPALLASAAQIRAATFQAEETVASFGPNVSLSASAGMGGFTGDRVAGQAQIGLSLSIPIYTPTRDPAVEQANIARMQSEVQAFANRDQVYEAVRQAWAGYNSAYSQIQSATAAVAATRLALEAVIDQSEVGQATTLDILDARATLLTVEEQLASAQVQRSIAAFSLVAAMGQLSATELALPVIPRAADGTYLPQPASATTIPASQDAWAGLR